MENSKQVQVITHLPNTAIQHNSNKEANHQTNEIIGIIKKRAAEQSLNRGLSLRLPYFDDQDLRIETHDFVVIPAGRIMFVPAFVVRAALDEQAKIAQDTRFSHSTRRHLMAELQSVGIAFDTID